MKTPWALLEEINADNGKLYKEAIIRREAMAKNDEFFQGLHRCFHWKDTFGVKKIPVHPGGFGRGLDWETFDGLCEQLIERDLTGKEAQNQIAVLMKIATEEQWNGWYRRILMKDLKAGFSESTVNKAVKDIAPQYIIQVFSCQLAHDAKDTPERICGTKIVDTKFDGARVLTVVWPDGRVFQCSRNGLEIANFPLIRSQFEKIAKQLSVVTIFDGEMMSANFQDLMKQFRRKTDVRTDDSIYYMFDIIPYDEFMEGESKLGQLDRRYVLDDVFKKFENELTNCTTVGFEIINLDTQAGTRRFEQINRKAIELGHEGVMVKTVDGKYQTKRSWDWMKLKPVLRVTLPVVAVEPGKPESQFANSLGALVCAGYDGDDDAFIEVNVGGGYTPELRARIWKMYQNDPGSIIGLMVEIEADKITQNERGEWSLRFPRFHSFRGLTPGVKI